MPKAHSFKWRHFQSEIILQCVRWYLSYPLSYRQLSEIMQERGIEVNYTTIYRWAQRYAPQLDKHCRPILLPTNDSWCVDETYIRVKGKWKYLYRAVDSTGSTLGFLLCAKRDCQAAKRFLSKALKSNHCCTPRVINVDLSPAYPKAVRELIAANKLPNTCELRQSEYLNNMVELSAQVY